MKNPLCLLIIAGVICCSGCRSPKQAENTFESIDLAFSSLKPVIYDHSDSARLFIKEQQNTTTDSSAFYFWEVQKGKSHYYCYQDSAAFECCRKSLDYCFRNPQKNGTEDVFACAYNLMGICFQAINYRDSALVYYKKAYYHINRTSYRPEMPNICINIADIYRQTGKYPEAVSWLRRALVVADSLGVDSQKHSICCGLGQVYADLRNFEMSDYYFSQADTVYPAVPPFEKYFFSNSRGNAYYFAKKYPEALECFRNAYSYIKVFNNQSFNAIVEGNLGEVFLLLGQIDSAKFYIDRSYDFYSGTSASDDAIKFYVTGLKAAYALDNNNYKEAKYYLSRPFDLKRMRKDYLHSYNQRLRDYYEARGDYKKAYQYEKAVVRYDDSLRNVQQINNTIEIENRYSRDTTLLRQNIVLAQNTTRISKLTTGIILTISIFIISLAAIFAFLWQMRRRKKEEARKQLATISKLRLESAQKNLSPHFIFNVLNAVVPALRNEESLPLNLLIKVLRGGLMASGKMAVTLEEELEMSREYADLRCCVSANAPKVVWNIAPQVRKDALIPTMSIQANVDNALKYAFPEGFEIPPEGKMITVTVSAREDEGFSVEIRDNGVGYIQGRKNLSEKKPSGTGNGIKILSQTYAILNASSTKKIDFSMCQEGGTVVRIYIPYEYNYTI